MVKRMMVGAAMALLAGCATTAPADSQPVSSSAEPHAQDVPGLSVAGKGTLVIGDAIRPQKLVESAKARAGDFAQCRSKAGEGASSLAGSASFKIVIDSVGKVVSITPKDDTLGAPDVSACLVAELKATPFPMPGDVNVTAIIPFEFTPMNALSSDEAAEAITRVLTADKERVEACHTAALDRNAQTAGQITVLITTDESGRVVASSIGNDTTEDKALAACVLEVVNGMSFDGLGETTLNDVAIPFIFTSADG